jgi:delta 1-pyrroline-5-carboxylate dehydrogenase
MTQITYDTVYTQGLADEQVGARFEQELAALRRGGPLECPHVIDGERVEAGAAILREDPTDPSRVNAHTYEGGEELVRRALAGAQRASAAWRRTSVQERCAILEEAARRLA